MKESDPVLHLSPVQPKSRSLAASRSPPSPRLVRGPFWLRAALILAACLPVGGLAQETIPAADDEFRSPVNEAEAAEIAGMIAKLGSPKPAEREQTATRLIGMGAKAFPQLREAYRRVEDLEVSLRIEEIIREGFLTHHVYSKNAFLGIRQSQVFIRPEENPGIPEGHVGIRIAAVIAGTAAEEAGLQAEDVIVRVNDNLISGVAENPVQTFVESIRARGPGAKIKLSVLRKGTLLEVEAILGARPKNLYAGQGPVSEMLMLEERRFAAWWDKHFARKADPRAEPEQPAPR